MKYYAVQKGRKPGIYTNWDECKAQVDKFVGAVYKSFQNYDEACVFLNGDGYEKKEPVNVPVPDHAYAFVDGSYNPETCIAGYGGFLVGPTQKDRHREEIILTGRVYDEEFCRQRNVAGEISGALSAIRKAANEGYDLLTIFYDYEGVKKWATGEWKAKNPYTREYAKIVGEFAQTMTINFVYTAGHTGIPGNERADKLAKEAVGIKI